METENVWLRLEEVLKKGAQIELASAFLEQPDPGVPAVFLYLVADPQSGDTGSGKSLEAAVSAFLDDVRCDCGCEDISSDD